MENRNHIVRYRPIIAVAAASLILCASGFPRGSRLGIKGASGAVGSVSANQASPPGAVSASATGGLAFEPNVGQAPAEARFIARGPGYSLMLTDDGPVLESSGNQPGNMGRESKNRGGLAPVGHGKVARGRALIARAEQFRASANAAGQGAVDVQPELIGANRRPSGASDGSVIRFRFIGAAPSPSIIGLDKQPSITNYLIGADPSGWHSAVPNFARVKYQSVYPGIDLVYYGSKGNLEYDAVVAPGADPGLIQLEVEGASSLGIDADGQLVAETTAGPIRQAQPHIYQMIGGARHQVTGGYQLTAPNRAGFAIGQYDHSRELVIDPDVTYTTTLGGSKATFADAIAVDSQGNAYISGGTTSPDFPTKNPIDGSLKGMQNAFITKLDAQGNILFSTFLGGSGIDEAFGIGVDSTGSAYVAGATSSTNFPTTSGGLQTPAGGLDVFVAKLSPDGSSLVYSSLLGGAGDDIAFGIAVSPGQGLPAGAVVITGLTKSPNLPTKNPFQPTDLNPRSTAFVSAVDPTGKALIYSSYLGGSGADAANGIAIDAQGNAYITGTTNSSNFPTTAAVFQPSARGGLEAFISAVSPTGALTASTFLGGTGDDQGAAIAVVPNAPGDQDVIVACSTTSSGLTSGPNPIQTAFMGQTDAYVAEIDHALQNLKNGTYLGGGNTMPTSVAVDSVKNICVAGATDDSADIPSIFPPALSAPVSGKDNAFLTVFDFNFPTTFPDNVNTSSAFTLGINNSDITGCVLTPSSIGGSKVAGDRALTLADSPGGDSIKLVGTAGDSAHQQTTVINSQFGSLEFSKDAFAFTFGISSVTDYINAPPTHSGQVGDLIVFRLKLHNNTSQAFFNLKVQDAVDFSHLSSPGDGFLFNSKMGVLEARFWPFESSNPFMSKEFDILPAETLYMTLNATPRAAGPATNTATLLPLGVQSSWDISILPSTEALIADVAIEGKQLEVLGANLAPKSAQRVSSTASGPVIRVDGVAQKTVPDSTYPDAILIAPKGGKKIQPGQTVTIQVQFPDGSTTNSIMYTRPSG